jgi:hydroxymethylbilane synthase
MNKKIVIGSRGSKLALIYAQTAKNKIVQNTDLNDEDIIIKEITTKGDQVKIKDYQKWVEKVCSQQT